MRTAQVINCRCQRISSIRIHCPIFRAQVEPFKDQFAQWYDRPRPIDVRYNDTNLSPLQRAGRLATGQKVWMRANGTLPDDPTLHACIVTYASDLTLLDTTVLPFGWEWDRPGVQMASLDHAMWFHRPFRADDWLLYDQSAISTGSARGLAGGAIFTRDGKLAITVVQEGLARLAP